MRRGLLLLFVLVPVLGAVPAAAGPNRPSNSVCSFDPIDKVVTLKVMNRGYPVLAVNDRSEIVFRGDDEEFACGADPAPTVTNTDKIHIVNVGSNFRQVSIDESRRFAPGATPEQHSPEIEIVADFSSSDHSLDVFRIYGGDDREIRGGTSPASRDHLFNLNALEANGVDADLRIKSLDLVGISSHVARLTGSRGTGGVYQGMSRISLASSSASGAWFVGGDGRDMVFGTEGDDVVQGRGGADHIEGRGGDDTLDGGRGPDFVAGNSDGYWPGPAGQLEANFIQGGRGDDALWGDRGPDRIVGGRGADSIDGFAGADRILADDGQVDHVSGGASYDGTNDGDADTCDCDHNDVVTEMP